jgi:hypothetical protein
MNVIRSLLTSLTIRYHQSETFIKVYSLKAKPGRVKNAKKNSQTELLPLSIVTNVQYSTPGLSAFMEEDERAPKILIYHVIYSEPSISLERER